MVSCRFVESWYRNRGCEPDAAYAPCLDQTGGDPGDRDCRPLESGSPDEVAANRSLTAVADPIETGDSCQHWIVVREFPIEV